MKRKFITAKLESLKRKKAKPKLFSKVKVIFKEQKWGDYLIYCAPFAASAVADLLCNCLVAGVGRYGRASTNTPIRDLTGGARYNAIMPHFCGGTLADGGGGIAGGETVLKILHTSVNASVQISVTYCGAIYNFHHTVPSEDGNKTYKDEVFET